MRTVLFILLLLTTGGCNPARKVSVLIKNDSAGDARVVVRVLEDKAFGFTYTFDSILYPLADLLPPGSSLHREMSCRTRDAIQCIAYQPLQPKSPFISAAAASKDPTIRFVIQDGDDGQITVQVR